VIAIKKKIAKTTTPMILNRCKETLKRFLADEKKAAYMIS